MAERITPGFRAALAATLLWAAPGISIAADGELLDPTKPPAALTAPVVSGEDEGEEAVSWKLTATITTGRGNRAVINGHHVKVGDTVRDAEVLSIRPGQVQLRGGDEIFTLTIVTDSIRRPATGIILPL